MVRHAYRQDSDKSTVCSWSRELAKLNSAFSRVARRSLPAAPPSWALSQDILRRWERAAREPIVMCNQAAGLSRCLTRVQDTMSTQLKTLHLDKGKGKSSERMQQAVDELEYFIALIHPIQWTIAYPVGADRPAKRQKKTSCVSTGWPVPVLCIRQVAHGTSFLSRQHDVISSFSFGACTVQTCFHHLQSFKRKVCIMTDFRPFWGIF